MNLNELNLDDAKKNESFGGDRITSGAYLLKIIKGDKVTSRSGTTSINLSIEINGAKRFTTLWMNKKDKDTGALVTNEYDSRRLKQLLFLLKIEPGSLTEVATDRDFVRNIPQLKGSTGGVIEVIPAGTKYNDGEYDNINIVSFFIFSTMQTVVEFTSKKQAETVMKEVEKLQKKEYIFTGSNQAPQGNSPQQFNVESDLTPENLPF